MSKIKFLLKTQKGREFIVQNFLKEKGIESAARPAGFAGLVLAEVDEKKVQKAEKFFEEIPEIEKAIKVHMECKAELKEIVEAVKKLKKFLPEKCSLAVSTTLRGERKFHSQEVNKVTGEELRKLGFKIDLTMPDYYVLIETLLDKAYISILEGFKVYKKWIRKPLVLDLLRKIEIVQLVYVSDDLKPVRRMGEAVGRAVQAFEVDKLWIVFDEPVKLEVLDTFLKGVRIGQKSRYDLQKNAYNREVHLTEIYVYDLYQFLRSVNRKKTLLIVTDPRGKTLKEIKDVLKKKVEKAKRIIVLHGSNKGIPPGCFKMVDFVVDLAPGITYATEQAIVASLISLINL